ncbi:MAG: C4-type zinc ribbon domain-containing protein [Chitinophagales bacterium]|nr:C4-type zinc ribbon domain-containing protein [Chitinophagales bacterium]MCZ2392843.1 C4-type zinc ribbon domain-containing protein [Chitinophagales bacterium]
MASKKDNIIAEKLDKLSKLQSIHTKIDQIQVLKGELPMEVADLEDEIAGISTRLQKTKHDITAAEENINIRRNAAKDAQALIIKYERQLDTVKNNREFDALSKEIELQKLDIQLAERDIKKHEVIITSATAQLETLNSQIDNKNENLREKKDELGNIVSETEKEENELNAEAQEIIDTIEPKLISAYNRIRSTYRNGLAVVQVERNACGGCFGKVPPQTQAEIKLKKKIISCEHCGRILTDVEEFDEDAEFIPAAALK